MLIIMRNVWFGCCCFIKGIAFLLIEYSKSEKVRLSCFDVIQFTTRENRVFWNLITIILHIHRKINNYYKQ